MTGSDSISEALRAQVETFLYQEARLLDTRQFEQWLDLFAPDATYWVPLEQDQANPHQTSSIIYDDRTLLAVRVRQYSHARAHARLPVSRTCHLVGNVLIAQADASGLLVASTLVVMEYRLERQRNWAATVEHRLNHHRGGFQIASKRVNLINSEAELDGITILF